MSGMLRALIVFVIAFSMAGLISPAQAEPETKPAKAAKEKAAKPTAADKEAKAADAKAKKEAAKKSSLRGHYAVMASEAEFSDQQREEVAGIVDELATNRKQWQETTGAKIKELSEKAKAAEGDEAKKLRAEMRELANSRKEMEAKYRSRIEGVMRPEQSRSWAAYGMYHRATVSLRGIDLTDAQKEQARTLADQMVSKEFDQKPADDEKIKAIFPAYLASVKADVLTPAQVSQLETAAAEKAAKRKKAADDKAKAKK